MAEKVQKNQIYISGFTGGCMKFSEFCKSLSAGLVLTAVTLGVACAGSCQITPEGITVLTADYALPEYQSYRLLDSQTILLQFNAPVILSHVHVSPADDAVRFAAEPVWSQTDTGDSPDCVIQVGEAMVRGTEYVLYAEASDHKGNSVHFSTVIHGFNENPAQLVLSEIRTTYSNPKSEFIELYARKGGNLAGMVLECVYGTKTFRYVFPDVEVSDGEYVVVHLRKLSDTCIDELGSALTECSHKDASGGRDLWRSETTKALGGTGAVILWNRAYGDMVDVLLYAESSKEAWPSTALSEAAQKAVEAGVWQAGPGIDTAAVADGMTVTRTLSRQGVELLTEYPAPAWGSDWFVVATGQGSPGSANSAIAYE